MEPAAPYTYTVQKGLALIFIAPCHLQGCLGAYAYNIDIMWVRTCIIWPLCIWLCMHMHIYTIIIILLLIMSDSVTCLRT